MTQDHGCGPIVVRDSLIDVNKTYELISKMQKSQSNKDRPGSRDSTGRKSAIKKAYVLCMRLKLLQDSDGRWRSVMHYLERNPRVLLGTMRLSLRF